MTERILHESSSAVTTKGKDTYRVVLITPGRGSSGDYSEEMLRAFGPDAFPAGSHSYVDHIAEGETRSTSKMIGVYKEGAHYEDGVGLVADLSVFSHYNNFVKEVAPWAGFSIYARGTGHTEDLDGEEVYIVEALLPHVMNSVDLVSYAGRGGHLAESLLQEAMTKSTQSESSAGSENKDEENMALEESVNALDAKFTAFLAAEEARASADAANAAEGDKVAEAVKEAVAATRKVAEAELSEKLREKLFKQIEDQNFDVDTAIAEALELRDEIKESLRESHDFTPGSFASESAGKQHDFSIGRWNH